MKHPSEHTWDLFSPVKTENNKTELFIDGPECLDMLMKEIRAAKKFIHVQVMLFYSDKMGFKFAQALAKKAREGIEVRVMSDSDMSRIVKFIEKYRSRGKSNFSNLKELFTESGVKFCPSDKESYRMNNWADKRIELAKKGVPENFLDMQDVIQKGVKVNANVLDHRKIFIFDGEKAVVTDLNIGEKYLYEDHPEDVDHNGKLWHCGALLLTGPCVTILNKEFASKWMVRGGDVFDFTSQGKNAKKAGTDECMIYTYFPGMKENYIRNYYLEKIKNCKGDFIIENPYINDDQFWETLISLKKEQASKISIINPYKSRGNDYLQSESAIKCKMYKPFENGVSFFNYNKRMTHCKIALDVAENEVFFGSYNLNYRSAQHDFEMNVLIKSKKLADKIKAMLYEDMTESEKITDADEFYKYPYLHPACLLLKATKYFE